MNFALKNMISTYTIDFSWKKKTPNSPFKPSVCVTQTIWPLPFTLESRLRQKEEELWKLKNISP